MEQSVMNATAGLISILKMHGVSTGAKSPREFLEDLTESEFRQLILSRRNDLNRQTVENIRGSSDPNFSSKSFSSEAEVVSRLGVLSRQKHYEVVYEPILMQDNDLECNDSLETPSNAVGRRMPDPSGTEFANDWIKRAIESKALPSYEKALKYCVMWKTKAWSTVVLQLLDFLEGQKYLPAQDPDTKTLGWPTHMQSVSQIAPETTELKSLENVRIKDIITVNGFPNEVIKNLAIWHISHGSVMVNYVMSNECVLRINKAYFDVLANYSGVDARVCAWRSMLREFLTLIPYREHQDKVGLNAVEDALVLKAFRDKAEESSIWERIQSSCVDPLDLNTFNPNTFIDTFKLATVTQKTLLKLNM